MNNIASVVSRRANKLILFQALVGVLLSAGYMLLSGLTDALSAFYGSFVSMLVAILLKRRVVRATELAVTSPGRSMGTLYIGAAFRFLLVLVLLAFGLKVLGLLPVPMVSGFVAAQLAYVFNINQKAETSANLGVKP